MIMAFNIKRMLRNLIVGGGILLVSIVNSGCRHGWLDERVRADDYTGSLYKFPHSSHPIHVSKGMLEMSIPVGYNDKELNSHKLNELRTFLHYYRDQGTGRLLVSMPTRSQNQYALRLVLDDVTNEMEKMSLGPQSIQVKKFSGRGSGRSALYLSFERHVAEGPDCENWNQHLAQDENNANSQYWGCASQHNLAAMVANPRDLKGPRGWSPRDARRRDVVMDKHIKGESTGAVRSQDERVGVSGIAQE